MGPKMHATTIVAAIMGIGSIPGALLCCFFGLPGLAIPFAVAGVICGFIGMGKASKEPNLYSGKGLAIAGLVCAFAGLALGLGLQILIIAHIADLPHN
jgi:hypothetical protein